MDYTLKNRILKPKNPSNCFQFIRFNIINCFFYDLIHKIVPAQRRLKRAIKLKLTNKFINTYKIHEYLRIIYIYLENDQ